MSEPTRFEYAIQEPAIAIAPVFLALKKGKRSKLDVIRTFGDATLQWRGPDTLGMQEQSVLLGLLSIAGQQNFVLDPLAPHEMGKQLLARLSSGGRAIDSELAVVKTSWSKIAAAAGCYKTTGGKNNALVESAMRRLAETTIWETRHGIVYESRLLAWVCGDISGVTVVLNRRATDALNGGQYVKISLEERNALSDDPSKALHAWLSGHMHSGSTKIFKISVFQSHVWGNQAAEGSSTLNSRLTKLRRALAGIARLPDWNCLLLPKGQVEVRRINAWTIGVKMQTISARDELSTT
jgi:hypothetical protein